MDKQLNNKKIKVDEKELRQVEAVKWKLNRSKESLDSQLEEMEGMLVQLQDNRKKMMDTGSSRTAPEGGGSEEERESVGGLDGLRERRKKRKEKLGKVEDIKDQVGLIKGPAHDKLNSLWSKVETKGIASGASSDIQTNSDGCPLYYKLLLNIESPKDVSKEQRQVYEFLKQAR